MAPSRLAEDSMQPPTVRRFWSLGLALCFLAGLACVSVSRIDSSSSLLVDDPHRRLMQEDDSQLLKQLELLQVSKLTVMGPSHFPKPSAITGNRDAVPFMKPTFGQHRPDQDAVLAFAAEYGLSTYLTFVTSLRDTGYQGDIVFAVNALDVRQTGVKEFFQNTPGLVVYVLDLICYNAEMEAVESAKGGMRVCQLHQLWGIPKKEEAGGDLDPLPDPREARTVATTRYELYWIWILYYQPHSWIMLLDARDSYFQTNPFANVPREVHPDRPDGILYFYGENMEATRIGLSPKNRKWLTNAYGDTVVAALQDKPTICSGSTMGEQIALESYLRAMVAEFDDTGTKLMGADQGFHNYLYYTNKLANAETIRSIMVFDQGRGAINNLGAMRTKALEEWGNGKLLGQGNNETTMLTVFNWDGTPSPVVHQFDRHKVLSNHIFKQVAREYRQRYEQMLVEQKSARRY